MLKLPLHFNLELFHVLPLSHVLPCFPTLKLSSLHLVIFRHPYLTHLKYDSKKNYAMNSTLHFSHIYYLDFYLKKNFLPSNFEKILWSTKFLKVPPCKTFFFFFENQDDFCFFWDLGFRTLTTWPFHSNTLEYWRHIHLISIEF